MKLKTDIEIKALAKESAGEPLPDKDLIAQWKCYVGGYEKGYTQAQQDLLASTSEGFEEYIDYMTSGGNYQVNRLDLHEQTWQACSISHTKNMQEKDAEIERLKREKSTAIKSLTRINKLLSNGEHLNSSWIKDIIEIQSSNIEEEMRLKGVVLKLQKENQEMRDALSHYVTGENLK